MAPAVPPPECLLLAAMRRRRGLSGEELAQRSGISSRMITKYENEAAPPPERLAQFAAVLGYDPEALGLLLLGFRDVPLLPGPRTPVDPDPEERRALWRAALDLVLAGALETDRFYVDLSRDRTASAARQDADRIWSDLRALAPARRRLYVETTREVQTWAVAEHLCAESVKAAAHDADLALELASLAYRVAELAPAEEPWRSALLGYVLAFVGNALRVRGDLPRADERFAEANRLWEVGAAAGAGPLPAWRLPDLEAALRAAQRQWTRALDLHARALAEAPPVAAGRILLNQSASLVLMGETERAIETLREAAGRIDPRREPRLLFALRFNLAANLCRSKKSAEAESLLPEVRELAIRLGNALDLARVLWIQAKIHASLDRAIEAIAAFEQVLGEFTEREIPYDAALVALELSLLYLEQGRTAEVQQVSLRLAWIFTAEGVDEETLKALTLFYEAAQREAATVELARRLVRYLDRASLQPGLPFEV